MLLLDLLLTLVCNRRSFPFLFGQNSPLAVAVPGLKSETMSRLPPQTREELSSGQQDAYDELSDISEQAFGPSGSKFSYKDDDGRFIGPYPFFLAAPEPGLSAMRHALMLGKLPLPPDAKETAILTCGAHFKAPYELYAHENVAKSTTLNDNQIESIKRGERPDELNEQCGIAFDICQYLCKKLGPLPQDLWDLSVRSLGRDGTVALIHYIGFYAYLCIALNATDVPVPKT